MSSEETCLVIRPAMPATDVKLIEHSLGELVTIYNEDAFVRYMSPQLKRKLSNLIELNFNQMKNRHEFLRRISSFFNRLLLELVQAHYNTKQREQDLLRRIKEKNCSISEPELTDAVIHLLINLYGAVGADASFERNVLVKYLLKELKLQGYREVQIKKVVQTLYKSSIFHVTQIDGKRARYKLKEEFYNSSDLRRRHDIELMNLAQEYHIRLPPDSWAYLLYKQATPDIISKVQSLLDKHQSPATVSELEVSIKNESDKYNIGRILSDLKLMETAIKTLLKMSHQNTVDPKVVAELIERLVRNKQLFVIRQCREQLPD